MHLSWWHSIWVRMRSIMRWWKKYAWPNLHKALMYSTAQTGIAPSLPTACLSLSLASKYFHNILLCIRTAFYCLGTALYRLHAADMQCTSAQDSVHAAATWTISSADITSHPLMTNAFRYCVTSQMTGIIAKAKLFLWSVGYHVISILKKTTKTVFLKQKVPAVYNELWTQTKELLIKSAAVCYHFGLPHHSHFHTCGHIITLQSPLSDHHMQRWKMWFIYDTIHTFLSTLAILLYK